jgi:hypothetical protein
MSELARQRPSGRLADIARLNDPCIAKQVGQIRPDSARQSMDRVPPVALGLNDGVGNVAARQWLLSPPERVRYEPVQLAVAEQLDPPEPLGAAILQGMDGVSVTFSFMPPR